MNLQKVRGYQLTLETKPKNELTTVLDRAGNEKELPEEPKIRRNNVRKLMGRFWRISPD